MACGGRAGSSCVPTPPPARAWSSASSKVVRGVYPFSDHPAGRQQPGLGQPPAQQQAQSNVQAGTDYERQVLHVLSSPLFGMQLQRVGSAGDGGRDLVGHWPALVQPSQTATTASADPLQVIVQCKAERKQVGPGYVRDLLGTLSMATSQRSSSSAKCVLGVLVSTAGFTEQAYRTASAGSLCLATIGLDGVCRAFWTSPKAIALLPGLTVITTLKGNVRLYLHGKALSAS